MINEESNSPLFKTPMAADYGGSSCKPELSGSRPVSPLRATIKLLEQIRDNFAAAINSTIQALTPLEHEHHHKFKFDTEGWGRQRAKMTFTCDINMCILGQYIGYNSALDWGEWKANWLPMCCLPQAVEPLLARFEKLKMSSSNCWVALDLRQTLMDYNRDRLAFDLHVHDARPGRWRLQGTITCITPSLSSMLDSPMIFVPFFRAQLRYRVPLAIVLAEKYPWFDDISTDNLYGRDRQILKMVQSRGAMVSLSKGALYDSYTSHNNPHVFRIKVSILLFYLVCKN